MASYQEDSNPKMRKSFFGSPAIKQNFSLLETIIFYITKNPSTPKCYLKLAQTCKYFFEKNPIVIVSCLSDNDTMICINDDDICMEKEYECCIYKDIDISKIARNKIWLTNQLQLSANLSSGDATNFFAKLFRCENAKLVIYKNDVTFEIFQLWCSAFHKYAIVDGRITYKDGSVMMLEKIIESIPNVTEFWYQFHHDIVSATSTTLKNISNLKNLSSLSKLLFFNTPEIFAIKDIADFIKKHNNIMVILEFEKNITEGYKNQLNEFIDTIIDTGVCNCLVVFDEQDKDKCKIMEDRVDQRFMIS